jgi:hypothetical protein
MIRDFAPLSALALVFGVAAAALPAPLTAPRAFAQTASAHAKLAAAESGKSASRSTSPAKAGAAKDAKPAPGKPAAEKPQTAKKESKANKAGTKTAKAEAGEAATKPALVGTFGDWGAYLAQGRAKTCYALGQPKDRVPPALKRDPAYIFISTRPGENVHNEVSIAMGFDVAATPEAKAEVGASSFAMVAKGGNLWVKNAAEESKLLDAMRKAGKLVVRASSLKGNTTVDSYSLSGLSAALDRVKKDCP